MNGPSQLQSHVGHLKTRVGACWPGSRAVFRGQDLHGDMRGIDWLELYVFGITGRRFSTAEITLLHGIWTLTSYPDTRLWNNRVAALAANARSASVLGLSAAVAVSEAGVYGGGPGLRAIDFFLRAGQAVQAGQDIRSFVHQELADRRIYGYGRPINSTDERLPALVALVKAQHMDSGKHYQLAFAVEEILLTEKKPFLKMNYAALTAALAADMGFTPRQYQLFNILKTLGGMPPCIMEAAEKQQGALFPTPCADVSYEGVGKRAWCS
ncbi:citryl-CoA lyase [Rhodoferax sp. AJA081-3]|uniref:hypothetical protein n=1 Tax=Rhodoferax sp. AJA081-3 TaxID=2752316 RepID=UPI001ADECF6B|nr:hypothetical protein [Rhodoferax sp. AJA081-3]QTN27051.1 citryl-CoA lyase [Rhodoferax sp. AJA081-3]